MIFIKENLARLLGAAQLFVFIASLVSEQLLTRVAGKGDISSLMVNISNNPSRWKISTWFALANSLGIVLLGILFYLVFNDEYRKLASLALFASCSRELYWPSVKLVQLG
jgi:predicted NodU family carbamoyl transferase